RWYTENFRKSLHRAEGSLTPLRATSATYHFKALYQTVRSRYNVLCMESMNKVASMRGIEMAFPFLDRDLISFLMGIPGELQSRNGVQKWILREAMRGLLPTTIIERRWKADFTDVVNEGVERDYSKLVRHLRTHGAAVRLGYVEADVMTKELYKLKNHIRGGN